ncbi:SDR family NAD(P)-dependent oxidoreductase [Hydrogenophaga sp.]|uniref:SDR family NAD(P)-dependent oxidoreductase n=1 Tax=Hydrogenophaga sp. TaxID=1904254 RepID=UPI0026344FA7|nr:SDR family NAD(P)-dependent oxidoreductase [Hydrogenophaga sp.]MCW5652744.1 SDR family oxidoreductase [Hydrogenophaga sp.]
MSPQRPLSVLVTGGATGIGLAIARGFIAQGHRVMISGSRPTVPDMARQLSSPACPVHAHVADLASEAQTLALAEETRRVFGGGCDVLVNCAGYSQKRNGEAIPPTEVSSADWNRILHINLTAPFLLCRELIPAMRERGWGRVINIASRGGRTYVPFAGADYAAAKAGLIGLTRHLAGTYAGEGITVNAIAPGRIDTPLSNTSSDAVKARAAAAIPAGRFGTPEEIAAVAMFLASDGAAYLTGACLDVNGGVFMA